MDKIKKLSNKRIALVLIGIIAVLMIMLFCWHYDYLYERNIPVLMYHDFHIGETGLIDNTYIVTAKKVEEQIKYLLDNGYTPIFFSDLKNAWDNNQILPRKPIIITTDDGYSSNYDILYPILKKYQVKATMFVVTSYVGKTYSQNKHFNWEQAKEMEESGLVEIHNHSLKHEFYSGLTKDKIIKNVNLSQKEIEKNLGARSVKVFSYPGGDCSKESRKILKELGFDFQMTGTSGLVNKNSDFSDVHRISIKQQFNGQDMEIEMREDVLKGIFKGLIF